MTASPAPDRPLSLAQTVEVETPELVVLSYTIAGVGSRIAAALIDLLICIVALLVIALGVVALFARRDHHPAPNLLDSPATSAALAIVILLQFAVVWLYYVLFEGLADGQSPGKRLMRLRVVHDSGLSIGLGASVVRNFLRIVDLQFGFTYLVGLTSIFVTRRGKRLGDLAADTIVIREGLTRHAAARAQRSPAAGNPGGNARSDPPDDAASAVARVSDEEFSVLERWAERYQSLDRERRATITAQLVARFATLLPDPVTHPRLREDAARLRWLLAAERRARAAGAAGHAARGATRERHAIIATGSARWAAFAARLAQVQRSGLAALGERGVREFVAEYRALAVDLARLRTASRAGADTSGELFYLGRLVAGGHGAIYRRRGTTARSALRFLAVDVPAEIRRSALPIALAATLLFLPAAIAWIAVVRQPSVAEVFIPETMLERANDGVRRAREESGYIADPQILRPVMSSQIITNNVQVTIAVFALGITGGVFSALLLVLNGVSLGGVMGLYQSKGILPLIAAFVAPHGVLELTAICIAGGAGFLIAAALLMPGDRTRRRALAENGRRAAVLLAGSTLLLVVAGSLEGMVSPIPWWPLSVKLCVSALTALLLVVYLRAGAGRARRRHRQSSPRDLISR